MTDSTHNTDMASANDLLEKFIFDEKDLRVCCVRLETSYQQNSQYHDYPLPLRILLAEFMSACALLAATLKFEGRLVLQVRSESAISLLMAECSSHGAMRAYARYDDSATLLDFSVLKQGGLLALTIEPEQGESYQGIVPLAGDNLAECLQLYFKQSEQLQTRLLLTANQHISAGILLQQLPAQVCKDKNQREAQWQEASYLLETLTQEELLDLPGQQILYRLFHQEKVRLLEQQALQFKCSCSQQRSDRALLSMGYEEAFTILNAQEAQPNQNGKTICINCEFCQQQYTYNAQALIQLFEEQLRQKEQQTLH